MEEQKEIPTSRLIEELANREGVEKISVGLYQSYELIKKYNNNRDLVNAKTVLIVHVDA